MTDNINYYGMQLKLREYEEQLLNEKNIKKLEFLILEIKSFIINEKELKEEFEKRVNLYNNKIRTKKYKDSTLKVYDEVKKLTRKLAKQSNRKLYYSKNKYDCEYFAYIRDINNKFNNYYTGDYPLLFLYNSILLPTIIFDTKETLCKNGNLENIKISYSLKSFYNIYSYKYNDIIEIPKDLEFYLSLSNIKIYPFLNSAEGIHPFNLVYVATSLCKVLLDLDEYINKKIEKYRSTKNYNLEDGQKLISITYNPSDKRLYANKRLCDISRSNIYPSIMNKLQKNQQLDDFTNKDIYNFNQKIKKDLEIDKLFIVKRKINEKDFDYNYKDK